MNQDWQPFFPVSTLGIFRSPNKYRNLFERVRLGQGYSTTWPIQGTPDMQGGRGLGRENDPITSAFYRCLWSDRFPGRHG
ncbi:MAG: hypothetical protein CM15mP130_2190 [Verrucomicrobiota bacterium]|nr:MAG: hypothetical protein CM15mP130_2190 [Verrucomicrobiota bacterium]